MAQAVPTDTRSTFLAQLLAPIAAPAAGDRRYLRELRDELEQAWSLVLHRYYAARAYREHCAHTRRAAEIERGRDMPEGAEEARAQLAMLTAVDRMMHIPAPTIGALRHKQKLRGLDGGRDRWEAAIAADEVRLEEGA